MFRPDKDLILSGNWRSRRVALEELLAECSWFIVIIRSNAPVRLLIFDNRVEIISPGCLPDGLTVESIKLGTAVVRNPFIASFCAKIDALSRAGLGDYSCASKKSRIWNS